MNIIIAIALTVTIYLPIMPRNECFRSPEALQFFQLMMEDSRQAREGLLCDHRLVAAAEARAAVLATQDALSHCDPQGICANAYVRWAGFNLPSSYTANGNQVESLFAGSQDMTVAYSSLANSPSHSRHLMGIGDMFEEQDHIGIAVVTVPGSRYGTYVSIIIAKSD